MEQNLMVQEIILENVEKTVDSHFIVRLLVGSKQDKFLTKWLIHTESATLPDGVGSCERVVEKDESIFKFTYQEYVIKTKKKKVKERNKRPGYTTPPRRMPFERRRPPAGESRL